MEQEETKMVEAEQLAVSITNSVVPVVTETPRDIQRKLGQASESLLKAREKRDKLRKELERTDYSIWELRMEVKQLTERLADQEQPEEEKVEQKMEHKNGKRK